MTSNKKEILDKTFKVLSTRVLGYGIGFMFVWFIANKYGTHAQGVFSIAFLFLSVGAMISKLGVETALVKWIAGTPIFAEKKSVYIKAINLILVSSTLIAAVLFFCAPLIGAMYQNTEIVNSVRMAALAIPFLAILDVSAGYFKGQKQIGTYGVYFHFLKYLFPFFLILGFYFLSVHYLETPILSYLIGLFLASLTIVGHILKGFKGEKPKKHTIFSPKSMILESYPMMISSAIVMIMGWSDVFILGFFASAEKIGIYSVAIKLAATVSFIYSALAAIATPKIAQFYKENKERELKETVSFCSKIMLLCGFPIFLTVFIFPDFFLGFFGEDYTAGRNVLRILVVAQLGNVVTGPVGPIFQMTGKQKKLQNFIMISLLVNIIISLCLVSFLGMVGVAIGSAIGMILWNVIGARFIWKKMKIKTWPLFIKKNAT